MKVGDDIVHYALIGYGAWGRFHARAITQAPNSELIVIYSRSQEKRSAAKEDYGVDVMADYHEVLSRDDVDVVDIVVPNHLHREFAVAALDAGKHVLLEKPMAVTVDECDEILAAAQRSGKVLAIGFELRTSALWGQVHQLIADGKIGEPLYGVIDLWRRPYRLGSAGWRFDPQRVGSWILEEPIHFFDLARWYMSDVGEPQWVFARAKASNPATPELHDNFAAMLAFPNDAFVTITHTLCAHEHHQTVKLTGTKGAIWAWWSGEMDRTEHPEYGLLYFDGKVQHELPVEKTPGEIFELVEEITAMSRAVLTGEPPPATGEDGKWAVKMCYSAEQSARTGQIVRL
ncbi:MAG TPA: Gfo/Idh/MocA family oxidoreductase [Armatimonadetes bacterium]|nr:Gfo/Idh/MocA family oxidoreductase [Armatimonadota bacterium]